MQLQARNRLTLPLVLCTTLLFSSCHQTNRDRIVGNWAVSKINGSPSPVDLKMSFRKDGALDCTFAGKSLHGTYRFTGDQDIEMSVRGGTPTPMHLIKLTATEMDAETESEVQDGTAGKTKETAVMSFKKL